MKVTSSIIFFITLCLLSCSSEPASPVSSPPPVSSQPTAVHSALSAEPLATPKPPNNQLVPQASGKNNDQPVPLNQPQPKGENTLQPNRDKGLVNEGTHDINCINGILGRRTTDDIAYRGRAPTPEELRKIEPCKLFIARDNNSPPGKNERNDRPDGQRNGDGSDRSGSGNGPGSENDRSRGVAPPSDQFNILPDWGNQSPLCGGNDKDHAGMPIGPQCNVIPPPLSPGVKLATLRNLELPKPQYGTPLNKCQVLRGNVCDELRWAPVSDLRAGEFVQIRIAPTNPNIMYAGTDSNDMTMYRSIDGGDTWKLVHVKGHAGGLAISPVDSNVVLYTNLEAPVQLTLDGADSWDSVVGNEPESDSYNKPFTAISFSEDRPDIVYTAALRGSSRGGIWPAEPSDIFKSTDSGATWQQTGTCTTCSSIQSIVVKQGDPNFIWAAADGGLQYSRDSGQTWSGNVIPYLKKVEEQYSDNAMATMPKVIGLAIHPDTPDIILAASSEFGIFRSTDAGISWEHSNTGLKTSKLHQVHFAPSNSNVAYLTTHNGVYRSNDGGKSWVERSGELKHKFLSPLAIHPRNENIVFVATTSEIYTIHPEHMNKGLHEGHGLYKSEDGGVNWTRSDVGIIEAKPAQIAAHPLFPFNIWVGGESGRGNLFTPDGGDTWLFSPSITSHYPMVYAFNYVLPTIIYATGWLKTGELTASTDNGASWYTLTHKLEKGLSPKTRELGLRGEGPSDFHIHGVAVAPSDPKIIYVGSVHDTVYPDLTFNLSGTHIWKSSDQGETFKEMSDGFPIETKTSINAIVVHPRDPQIAYVVTSLHETETAIGIYKTTDGAKSWVPVNQGLDPFTNDLQMDPINPEILYASSESGIYKTNDGAKSWRKASKGIPAKPVIDMAMDPLNPLVLYAITPESIYRTQDGAENWYPVNSGIPILPDKSGTMSAQERLLNKLKLDRTKTGHSMYGGIFAQDRTLEIDATGRIIVVVVKTNRSDEERRSERLVYRAVLDSLVSVRYEFSVEGSDIKVDSQSNIYDMKLDTNRKELHFVAAGPAGTKSTTTLVIDDDLLSGEYEVRVDGRQISASSTTYGVSYEHLSTGRNNIVIQGK